MRLTWLKTESNRGLGGRCPTPALPIPKRLEAKADQPLQARPVKTFCDPIL